MNGQNGSRHIHICLNVYKIYAPTSLFHPLQLCTKSQMGMHNIAPLNLETAVENVLVYRWKVIPVHVEWVCRFPEFVQNVGSCEICESFLYNHHNTVKFEAIQKSTSLLLIVYGGQNAINKSWLNACLHDLSALSDWTPQWKKSYDGAKDCWSHCKNMGGRSLPGWLASGAILPKNKIPVTPTILLVSSSYLFISLLILHVSASTSNTSSRSCSWSVLQLDSLQFKFSIPSSEIIAYRVSHKNLHSLTPSISSNST